MHITRRPVVRRPSRVWKVTLSWAVVAAACASVAAVAGAPLKSGGRALATRPSPPVTQLIVRFHDETTSGERVAMTVPRVDGLSKTAGAQLLYRRPMAELAHVFRFADPVTQTEAEAVAARLRRDPAIADVEIDDYLFPLFEPNDGFYVNTTVERMWYLKAPTAIRAGGANLPTAWDITRGGGAKQRSVGQCRWIPRSTSSYYPG